MLLRLLDFDTELLLGLLVDELRVVVVERSDLLREGCCTLGALALFLFDFDGVVLLVADERLREGVTERVVEFTFESFRLLTEVLLLVELERDVLEFTVLLLRVSCPDRTVVLEFLLVELLAPFLLTTLPLSNLPERGE